MGVESSAVTSAVDADQLYYIVFFNEAYTKLETTGRTYTSTTFSFTPITNDYHADWGTISDWEWYTTTSNPSA